MGGAQTQGRKHFAVPQLFLSKKKDKLSNLVLPHFIHMQNVECNINFSAVYEALCQIGKKPILE